MSNIDSGKVTIGDEEFGLSQDLKDIGQSVSTALGLQDQDEGVKVVLQTQGVDLDPRPGLIQDAVRHYHDRRLFLLQDIRIILQESSGTEDDRGYHAQFQSAVREILEIGTGPPSAGSAFLRKCLRSMKNVEDRFTRISEELQGRQALPGQKGTEAYELLDFQRTALFQQHEALGSIVAHLFRNSYSTFNDLRELMKIVQRWKQLDFLLVHYLPAFSAAFRLYGSPEHSSTREDADALTGSIRGQEALNVAATLQPFQAVLSLWWTVEYSSWFRDLEQSGQDAEERVDIFRKSLKENALELLLSLCSHMNFEAWRQPARHELLVLLLHDVQNVSIDEEPVSDFFATMFMESLESFAEAWVTNMPDQIRELKTEEDQQRLLHIVAMHENIDQSGDLDPGAPLHLESLLVLLAFAFEGRPLVAEEAFWQDPDGNLFGFLQWASKRQPVPRVSAFCEMLCAIAEGPECAEAAHKFLLDETAASSGRGRRNPSMSFQQIFAELELYARKVHERPPATPVPQLRKLQPTEMNELESPIMLSCYLQLLAHLCRHTVLTRQLLLNPSVNIPQSLLQLSSGPIPSYLRASVFKTLEALLTEKSVAHAAEMWKTIDQWAASEQIGPTTAVAKTDAVSRTTHRKLQTTLTSISTVLDQTEAFVSLLCVLMSPSPDEGSSGSMLPFPADLGASYRSPGITAYVDWIFGQVFTRLSSDPQGANMTKVLSLHCLNFIAESLESFNEEYVTLLSRAIQSDVVLDSVAPLSPESYCKVHPFARTMQWLFGDDASKTLINSTAFGSEDLDHESTISPIIPAVERALDVLILLLDLQPTYLNVVRPLSSDADRQVVVIPSGFDRFEDAISARPQLVQDLCAYAAADNDTLVYKSLNLLQRLSSSARLNNHFLRSAKSGSNAKRVVDMLGPNATTDLQPVTNALYSHLQFDERELEEGCHGAGYEIKDTILSFLTNSLGLRTDLPGIAHLLLGFARTGERLDILPDGQLDRGSAVVNAIMSLAQDYPDGDDEGKTSWLLHVKCLSMTVLRMLWSTEISKDVCLSQLRRYKFLQYQFSGQDLVSRNTLWDGRHASDEDFWFDNHADGLASFLDYRASLYDYVAIEIKEAANSGQTSRQKQCLATILGKSSSLEGVQMNHPTICDLFDFVDVEIAADTKLRGVKHFAHLQFDQYMSQATDDEPAMYLLDAIRELFRSKIRSLTSVAPGQAATENQEEINNEADLIISYLGARNRLLSAQRARRNTLRAWTDSILNCLEYCPMDTAQKIQFVLHLLQIVLPRLDQFVIQNLEDSFELARTGDALLVSLSRLAVTDVPERSAAIMTERLFQLFRICIEAIPKVDADSALRNLFYNICCRYLTRIAADTEVNRKARVKCLDCVRSSGSNLVVTVSNDAEEGLDLTKPAALSLLALLTALARNGKSSFVVDALTRENTVEILIDPIQYLATELRSAESPSAVKYILTVFNARTIFLLELSRTKAGATSILDAGLLQTIRDSTIFQADPDLGIGKFPFLVLPTTSHH